MKKFGFVLAFMLIYSVAVFSQQGGYALKFDGTDDYVNIAHNEAFNVSQVTIETWFKWENSTLGTDVDFLIAKGFEQLEIHTGGGSGDHGLRFIPTSGVWLDTDPSVFETGKWYHVAFVYNPNASYYKCYINGKEVNLTNRGGSPVNTAIYTSVSDINIGVRTGAGMYFEGFVDELRIWNTVRTADEIKSNMFRELNGSESGLVAYYKMNGGTGAVLNDDKTSSNLDGVINGALWKASGCFAGSGQALDFDGINDNIACNLNSSPSNVITIEAYVSFNNLTNQQNFIHINDGNNTRRIVAYKDADNAINLFAADASNNAAVVSSNFTVEADKWYHIAYVYNNRRVHIYINGVLYADATISYDYALDGSDKLFIAADYGTGFLSNVKMDEIRIWNTARTQEQIREHMMKTLAGNESGLIVYYRCDQTDGTTLYDITSNGNNGTLTNMEATDWVISTAFNTWLGGESNAWATAANWSNGVPASAQNTGIYNWSSSLPDVTTYLPELPASLSVNSLQIPSGVNAIGNVNLSATGSVLLGSDLTLSSVALSTANNLVIESGATLTLPSSAQLTVSGTLTNNAGNSGLVIESGASLLHNSSGVAATVKREITGSSSLTDNKYHFVAIPTQYASPTSELFLGSYLYKLDPSQQEATNSNYYGKWVGLGESTTTPLNLNEGYMVYYPGNSIEYTFSGDLNNGTCTPALTGHTGTYTFNLIPNPYPSAIDWGASSGWTRSAAVGGTAYIWNSGSGNYTSVANSSGNYIPAGQGFIVAVYNSTSPAISMNNSVRAHSSQPFYKSGQEINTLRIEALANNYKDETVIAFTEEATETFDLASDGLKLSGLSEAPQLYTTAQGEEKYSINQLPTLTGNREVPLYFETEFTGEVVLNSSGTESFEEDLSIYLKDKLTGLTLNLRTNSEYRFQHTPANSKDRFSLIFGGTIGLDEPAAENISSWFSGNTFYLSTPEYVGEKAKVEVFSVSGQLLFSRDVTLSNLQQFNLNAKGAVITRVTLNNKVLNTKAIVL